MSKDSPAWRSQVGVGTTVGFKAGIGAKGNSGVTSSLKTEGAIGYVAAAYLIGAGLAAIAVAIAVFVLRAPRPEEMPAHEEPEPVYSEVT